MKGEAAAMWQEISEKDWGLIPAKKTKEPDEVDQMLDAVAEGKIIRYTPKDEKDAIGKRLSLGRRAKGRGFTIEIRVHGGQLAVRKTGEVVSQLSQPAEIGVADDTPPVRRRGRPRKRATTEEASEVGEEGPGSPSQA